MALSKPTKDLMTIVAVCLLLATPSLGAASSSLRADVQLLDFELEDQFGNVHRVSDVQGKIVLLIGSDKGGSSFNGLWGNAIHESLKDHPQYDQISELPYSDLRGVPFFLKGLIRGKFPENPDNWVLMDWKGILAKTYDFVPKASNQLVFAPDGTLVHHASGREPDDKTLEEIVTELRSLLDELDGSSLD